MLGLYWILILSELGYRLGYALGTLIVRILGG